VLGAAEGASIAACAQDSGAAGLQELLRRRGLRQARPARAPGHAHRRRRPASGWPRSAPRACCPSAACPPRTRASGPRSPPGPPAAPVWYFQATSRARTREVTRAMTPLRRSESPRRSAAGNVLAKHRCSNRLRGHRAGKGYRRSLVTAQPRRRLPEARRRRAP
jgi:hypothetical protein